MNFSTPFSQSKRSNRYPALRSYIEDFRAQHYQYESHREIFMAAPSAATDTGIISLRELIDFISHVADAYPEILKDFPQQLIDMLMQHHLVLEPELREKLVGSLVLLKKKDLLDSATYVHPIFSWHFGSRVEVLTGILIADSSKHYSPSLSLRLARLYVLCCFKRFCLSFGQPTLRRRTTSSTALCRLSFSIWYHLTAPAQRHSGPSNWSESYGSVKSGLTPRLSRS